VTEGATLSARRLTDGVWLVGSGAAGERLSDDHDCHVFLVNAGAEAALIDCGTGLATEAILRNVEQVCSLDRIGRIFVTHYHGDHAGGASALRARTGAQVAIGHDVADVLRRGDENRTQLAAARRAGIYPPDYRLTPCEVDLPLRDNDMFEIGDCRVTAVASPGHCDGHVSYLLELNGRRMLFSGDCIFVGGKVSIQAIPDCRLDVYARTAARLAELSVQMLLPGHLEFDLENGSAHLSAAAASFARLVPPPNILS
jgi:glyoxylase-like metal-dependent hydrolase (beta-lactamase superfamily II)